jgi:hypothetical protein
MLVPGEVSCIHLVSSVSRHRSPPRPSARGCKVCASYPTTTLEALHDPAGCYDEWHERGGSCPGCVIDGREGWFCRVLIVDCGQGLDVPYFWAKHSLFSHYTHTHTPAPPNVPGSPSRPRALATPIVAFESRKLGQVVNHASTPTGQGTILSALRHTP